MTNRLPHTGKPSEPVQHQPTPAQSGHGGHRWMMMACCIPMVIIVGILVATGVAGTGAIVYAAVCLGMMALMMLAMPGGHHH